ncbi:MAG TPA: hypothetical protein VGT78_06680 [Rhizomicrobium sp.]|nr:hypothetical protein [Rhizomicrobium sp.]
MSGISRRPFLASALALIGVAAVGGGAYEFGLFRKHFSKYGDLLNALDNPDNAEQVGSAVLATMPDFDAVKTAGDLRTRIGKKSLADVLIADAQANRVIEASGWVLPETLALLCALAAKS